MVKNVKNVVKNVIEKATGSKYDLVALVIDKVYDVIWCATNNSAEFFKSQKRNIFVFLQCIQRFVINSAFDQMILSDITFFQCIPKGSVIDQLNHRL